MGDNKTSTKKTTGRPASSKAPRSAPADLTDVVAAAWVAAMSARVAELTDAIWRVYYLPSHPEQFAAAVVLKTVLDKAALDRLRVAVEQAEIALKNLLLPGSIAAVPDLAAACMASAAALSRPARRES